MPKTNIEQLKEKMRKRFFIIFTDEKDKENDYYDSQFTGLKPTDVADWWLKELDQAVQARNEELVELAKQLQPDLEEDLDVSANCLADMFETKLEAFDYGVNEGIKKVINLISPGRK